MRKVKIYLDEQDAKDIAIEAAKGNDGLFDIHTATVISGEGIHITADGDEVIMIELHITNEIKELVRNLKEK